MHPDETIYAGEAQFAGWRDSHTSGPIIMFRLPDSESLDKFRAMTVAKAHQAGHLVMLAIVEQGEEGEPVPPPQGTKSTDSFTSDGAREAGRRQVVGPYCREAVELCDNPNFRRWLSEETGVPVPDEKTAKQGMLGILGIGSRKEIDGSEELRRAFIDTFRVPFMHWQREQRDSSRGEGGGDAWDEGDAG